MVFMVFHMSALALCISLFMLKLIIMMAFVLMGGVPSNFCLLGSLFMMFVFLLYILGKVWTGILVLETV